MASANTSPAQYLSKLDTNSFKDDGERSQALLEAYALIARLETPWETVARIGMNQPAVGASLKILKDLNLFEKWNEKGNVALNTEALAALINVEAEFLSRILRHLAANHMLQETDVGVFKPTPFTISLIQPVFGEWINYLYDAIIPCYFNLPEYMAKTNYRSPSDPANGVFQYAKGLKDKDLFQYYAENAREGASFNNVMGGVMATQASWLEIFPHETILADAHANGPLLVDVGGNVGHDLGRFYKAHPETASRLYLQDRPDVVARSTIPDPVNKMGHNFFEVQPIKHARVYYMHGVLHDWPDDKARDILLALRGAMKPGYSKVLVHDHVLPERAMHPHGTSYDLTMMVKVAGKERTEQEWKRLLAEAGYKLNKVWRSPLAVQGILEAEVTGEKFEEP